MPPKKKRPTPDTDSESDSQGGGGAAAAAGGAAGSRKSARIDSLPPKDEIAIGSHYRMKRVEQDGLIALMPVDVKPNRIIVGFDMDDTLITTKSGKVFATGRNDWRWLFPSVPQKLREEAAAGKQIVIFSNQGGIKGDVSKGNMIVGKITDLLLELALSPPPLVFLATEENEYRKPSVGMFDTCQTLLGGEIDTSQSIYVGDAAGRAVNWKPGRKKDFSCSDRKFAYNTKVEFKTPEEYFLGEKSVPFGWDGVGPDEVTQMLTRAAALPADCLPKKDGQEMVILIGYPASGKSTLASQVFEREGGYVRVNRDTLKTPAKCLAAAENALKAGKSVIIDNTNPSKSARCEYIDLARSARCNVRCLWMEISEEQAKHLNLFRERMGISDHVPRIAYATFKKNFEEPTAAEGFSSISRVPFVAKFDSEVARHTFSLLA